MEKGRRENICQVALLSSIIVELWPYGSVICEIHVDANIREYALLKEL